MRVNLLAALLAAAGAFAAPAQAQTEIQWWHSMQGALGEALNGLADQFNAEQKEYKIVTSFKGQYPESMTAAIAAFRAGQAPHLLQVFEVGTATMMAAKGAIYPVHQLMADAKEPFDPKHKLHARIYELQPYLFSQTPPTKYAFNKKLRGLKLYFAHGDEDRGGGREPRAVDGIAPRQQQDGEQDADLRGEHPAAPPAEPAIEQPSHDQSTDDRAEQRERGRIRDAGFDVGLFVVVIPWHDGLA